MTAAVASAYQAQEAGVEQGAPDRRRPFRLLMVTGIFPPDLGGPASYVPRMAAAFTRRGWQVEVLCLSDRLDHDDTVYPFAVKRLPRAERLPMRLMRTTLAVWRRARSCDLVYVNGLASEATLGAFLAGRPTVHKIVGDYAWERASHKSHFAGTIDDYQRAPKTPKLRLFDAVRTTPVRFAHEVIVPSRYLARLVAGWGIPEEKIRVIYNALPERKASGLASTLPPWQGRTLITVCRLVGWKGIDPLLRVLSHLPDTRLVVAGSGPLEQQFRGIAQQCGVADRVVWLGNVPSAAVGDYLALADAFVLNSTYEGLPHAVLEAMQAGIPVIATDVGGTSEVITHGENGLLIPVNKSAALQQAILRLWEDPALRTQLAEVAAARLAREFSFHTMFEETCDSLLRAAHSGTPTEARFRPA